MSANFKLKFRRPDARQLLKALGLTVWVVLAFFIAALLAAIIKLALEYVGLGFNLLGNSTAVAIESGLVYLLAALVGLGVPYALHRSKTDRQLLGLERLPQWSDIGLGLVAWVPYFLLAWLGLALAAALWPGFNLAETQEIGFKTFTNQAGMLVAFFTLVVVAPVAEEILLRGYLYGKLRRYIGLIGSILLTSLCFAVLHGQLNVGIDVFMLSVVLCLLRETTGSIWAGIILHATKNSLAYFMLFIAPMMIH